MKIAGATAMAIISRIAQTVRRSMDQITWSGDRIEPARMKRMTSSQSASSQPHAFERTVASDGLESVLGAGGCKATARRQRGRHHDLVSPDERRQQPARNESKREHDSPREYGVAPGQELGPKRVERGAVGLTPRSDDQVQGRLARLDVPAPNLAQSAAETIAGHRG